MATINPYATICDDTVYKYTYFGDDSLNKTISPEIRFHGNAPTSKQYLDEYLVGERPKLATKDIKTREIKPDLIFNFPEFRYLDKISWEVEGAWKDFSPIVHKDLSFSVEDFPGGYESIGEIASKPYDNLNDWAKGLVKNYPDYSIFKCGFHFHISVKSPIYYNILMEKEFYSAFLDCLMSWGEKNISDKTHLFWQRIYGHNGMNKYCKNIFMPDLQAAYREKGHNRQNRRTVLNYTYNHLGTIECRILPMFDNYNLTISAVSHIVSFIEEYLSLNNLKKISFTNTCVDKVDVSKIQLEFSGREFIPNYKMGKYNHFLKKIVKPKSVAVEVKLVGNNKDKVLDDAPIIKFAESPKYQKWKFESDTGIQMKMEEKLNSKLKKSMYLMDEADLEKSIRSMDEAIQALKKNKEGVPF